ncbi:hypothetical protein ACFVZD_40890 [Streptomyces sp. NPDC058287]|uniref:hypothetical protein n=1 Tax=unclassified Streptomyces TaxID=2593676 RepID=UPI0036E3A523
MRAACFERRNACLGLAGSPGPVGAKVFTKVGKYARIVGRRKGESEAQRQQGVYDFMNDVSFKDFIGDIPADAQALFEPTVTRSAGDIDQISAGAGVGYFSLVWNIGAGLSNSIVNGASTLTETIAAALGERVRLGAVVREVVQKRTARRSSSTRRPR